VKNSLNRGISRKHSGRENLAGSTFDTTVFFGRVFSATNLEASSFQRCEFSCGWLWKITLCIVQLLLLTVAGAVVGAGGLLATGLMRESFAYGISVLLSLLIALLAMSYRGLLFGAITGTCSLVPLLLLSVVLPTNEHRLDISLPFFVGSGAIALNTFGIGVAILAIAISMILTESAPLAIGSVLLPTFIVAALTATIFKSVSLILPVVMVILLIVGYLGLQAVTGNSRFQWVVQTAIAIIMRRGNLFIKTNLTDVDFTGATLKFCDFRSANLIRVRFYKVKRLEFARLGSTYLANSRIRQLVVTCDGQGQNFDGLDLTGVNLQNAQLQDASFTGSNLNQSNLQGADLSRAVLKQTQLEGADLTGAVLTGACIEDWGITSTTKLENVQCEYVFMRVPTKENPNPLRKPDNWQETFAEGEFADFIQPYFDTLDLYHSQDVDPRAISIAFKKLSQNHPEANLEIVAMEKRGQSSFNLKVRTAPTADKSELSSEYFADYNQLKALSEARLLLLAEKDERIYSLEQMIQTALHQPTFNVETVQGDFMPENKGISIGAGDNANISGVSSGDGIVNLGTISGNVTNAINQLPDSSETGQASLKALLTQLQEAIEMDTDLPDPDKSDLLEQVQSLAEAKQTEEPTKREGMARKALKMFDATLKSLPDTAKIVEACSKLLPLILKALGIPA
jgi:uncharacterized protein YjbI with pentapeptide repeats